MPKYHIEVKELARYTFDIETATDSDDEIFDAVMSEYANNETHYEFDFDRELIE